MRKKLLSMLLALCMVFTLLPMTASAAASTLEIGSGTYALDETGLNAAIAAANGGDTISFTGSGTITLTNDILINKSITLDLNGKTINFTGEKILELSQVPSVSVSIQGPGTITMNRFICISSGSTLTVNGGAVIEGNRIWYVLENRGTVSMTDGTLKQTGTGFVLLNTAAGVATFDNATIEGKNSNGALIWNAESSTLTLNSCTTRNIYSGTGSWATMGSIIYITHTSTVNLIGGAVTGPTGSSAPTVVVASGTTFTNNGATITNGYVKKLGDLTVSVSSGINIVTLASQTPETGVTYYYKTTATDDTAHKPASDGSADFISTGWTAFSTNTDIPASVTAAVYVQVVKVGNSEQKICGWGQGSAIPTITVPISNFTKTSQTTTTAAFSWTAATGATSVKVQQSLHGANTWFDATTGAIANDSTTATVTGLTAATAYDFKLVVTGGENAGDSNTVTVTTDTAPPSGGGSGIYTPPAPVTKIDNGGSTTGSNLGQLVSGGKALTVEDSKGVKLVFDTEALKGIIVQTSSDIKVEMKNVSPAHQENLPGKQVFSLTVSSGGSTITNFGGSVTVTLPYTLKSGETAQDVTVWYLASDGTMTEIPCTYDPATGLATFTVTHFSLYVAGVDTSWVNPFSDVRMSDWFYGAVEFVSRNGIMNGIGGTAFSPSTTITRDMLVSILWRMENEPAATKTVTFTDVTDGKWYAKAVAWAAANNIVAGYDGKFDPGGTLTREQLTAILYRYATYKSYDMSAKDTLSAYTDKPSAWALSSVSWAVAEGLIKGSDGRLDPKGGATRAQAASILQRFIENMVK